MHKILIVGNTADNPFTADIAHHMGQNEEYSDLISLKEFLNSEFCPRFIIDEENRSNIGYKLKGYWVFIVSTSTLSHTRNDLSMRNCLIARAARDNGADRVFLIEPDLFFSAQDRGPRQEHGMVLFDRDTDDYSKFDGQPFSARLYAELLQQSGVDGVLTIHNHSHSVKNIFLNTFFGNFHNLQPAEVYASYIRDSDILDPDKIVLCAPDKGALPFVKEVKEALGRDDIPLLIMSKNRSSERDVHIILDDASEITLDQIGNRHIAVVDDMVRTGKTIVECCKYLRKGHPGRVVFFVTHFYSSQEGRILLNDPSVDEIVTTNTIPSILNRDSQGRLRKKMVVLLMGKWITKYLMQNVIEKDTSIKPPYYGVDISSKNPRWRGELGPLFQDSK